MLFKNTYISSILMKIMNLVKKKEKIKKNKKILLLCSIFKFIIY